MLPPTPRPALALLPLEGRLAARSRVTALGNTVRATLLHQDLARSHQGGDPGGQLSGVRLDVHTDHEALFVETDAHPVDAQVGPWHERVGDLAIVGLDLPPRLPRGRITRRSGCVRRPRNTVWYRSTSAVNARRW